MVTTRSPIANGEDLIDLKALSGIAGFDDMAITADGTAGSAHDVLAQGRSSPASASSVRPVPHPMSSSASAIFADTPTLIVLVHRSVLPKAPCQHHRGAVSFGGTVRWLGMLGACWRGEPHARPPRQLRLVGEMLPDAPRCRRVAGLGTKPPSRVLRPERRDARGPESGVARARSGTQPAWLPAHPLRSGRPSGHTRA